MRLAVDASVLVGELLKIRGREHLGDGRLEFFLPEPVWGEVQHELPRRIATLARRRRSPKTQAEELVRLCLVAVEANVGLLDYVVFAPLEDEGRSLALRDPNDWTLVACALAAAEWDLD